MFGFAGPGGRKYLPISGWAPSCLSTISSRQRRHRGSLAVKSAVSMKYRTNEIFRNSAETQLACNRHRVFASFLTVRFQHFHMNLTKEQRIHRLNNLFEMILRMDICKKYL